MTNLALFSQARDHQPLSEIPFLHKQCQQAMTNKPFKGLKVIQNIPLSIESICKLEPLVLGGADVTVTINRSIHPSTQPEAIKLVEKIGLRFTPTHLFAGDYDFVLDCGGELASMVRPKQGVVELTQTGSKIYEALKPTIPVLSVDNSLLKQLETFFGTGEGCVRALQKFTGQNLSRKHCILFGYGRVGQGAAHFLAKEGAKLTIVDVDPAKLSIASKRGYQALNLYEDRAKIEKEIFLSHIILTATGVKGVISSNFNKLLFDDKILANLGVQDEFGLQFQANDVLFSKEPINFSLTDPTKMRYLDPSFYAHNYGIEYILQKKPSAGFHPFPVEIDRAIVQEWKEHFKEDVSFLQA